MLLLNGLRLGWLLFGGAFALLFWMVLVAMIVVAIQAVRPSDSGKIVPSSGSPLEILQVRYARGEISKDEFENIRRTLTA